MIKTLSKLKEKLKNLFIEPQENKTDNQDIDILDENLSKWGTDPEILNANRKMAILEFINEAQKYLKNKDYVQAFGLLLRAQKLAQKADSNDTDMLDILTELWNLMAVLWIETKGAEDANKYADMALKINPSRPDLLNNKGLALELLGDYNNAIVWFDKALKIDPSYVKALNNKGKALKVLGKYTEAIKYFDKVLKINPNYERAINNKSKT